MNPFEVLMLSEEATVSEVRTAYHKLARRWHPDRFLPGPERDWANERMAEINSAYRQCLSCASDMVASDSARLNRAQKLLEDGMLSDARRVLMSVRLRCAEWNYLFGVVLMRLNEYRKAAIYLSIAVHQQPDNEKYLEMLTQVRNMSAPKKLSFISSFR